MVFTKQQKQDVIDNFKTHAKDTGSAEVQVAILSGKIDYLSEHLKVNKKDYSSRRGLLMMIGQRRRLLDYLKKNKPEVYEETIKKLNLRK